MTADSVVDASALAAATFLEPRALEVRARFHGKKLAAPQIIRFEVSNVCVKKIRTRLADRTLLFEQYAGYLSLPIDLHAVDQMKVVELAEQSTLSAYDASYLWLSRHLGIELVTLDDRLQKAAAKL